MSIKTLSILLVDDEPNIRKTLTTYLESLGHRVSAASNSKEALSLASQTAHDLAFVDLRLGTESGLDLIPALLEIKTNLAIIVITAYASIDTAVTAIRNGAKDYIPKPFNPDLIDQVLEKYGSPGKVTLAPVAAEGTEISAEINLNSSNVAMQHTLQLAHQVADSDANILIRGESGTGKGVLARHVHYWSRRAQKPFAVISCPSLSASLLESELFGHVKGSFTGAIRDNPGRIASSDGGTVFLDEIGDLPQNLQPKLLRFIQDLEYEMVGDTKTYRADVRIVAATNCNLEEAVRAGKFREDLYYRLKVFQLDIPPLRDRKEDLKILALHFLNHFNTRYQRNIEGFTETALRSILEHGWPGNVRELRNAIEYAAILCKTGQVELQHLPLHTSHTGDGSANVGDLISLEELEKHHIEKVLGMTSSVKEAAAVLGIDQATLWRRRKNYGMT